VDEPAPTDDQLVDFIFWPKYALPKSGIVNLPAKMREGSELLQLRARARQVSDWENTGVVKTRLNSEKSAFAGQMFPCKSRCESDTWPGHESKQRLEFLCNGRSFYCLTQGLGDGNWQVQVRLDGTLDELRKVGLIQC
jgi:hypothetical protein